MAKQTPEQHSLQKAIADAAIAKLGKDEFRQLVKEAIKGSIDDGVRTFGWFTLRWLLLLAVATVIGMALYQRTRAGG